MKPGPVEDDRFRRRGRGQIIDEAPQEVDLDVGGDSGEARHGQLHVGLHIPVGNHQVGGLEKRVSGPGAAGNHVLDKRLDQLFGAVGVKDAKHATSDLSRLPKTGPSLRGGRLREPGECLIFRLFEKLHLPPV